MGLLDNFTGSNGTLLTAHTSDSSHTWAKCTGYTADMEIQSNGIVNSATSVYPVHAASWAPTSANYYAEIALVYPSTAATQFGLYVRADPANIGTTSYGLAIVTNNGSNYASITLYRGGTSLASWTDTVTVGTYSASGATIRLAAQTNGSQVDLTVKFRGTTVITYSDTAAGRITSTGQAALYEYSSGVSGASHYQRIDSITGDLPAGAQYSPAGARAIRGLYTR